MWVEAILSREDLTRALEQACPLTIRLGDDGRITLDAPRGVALVPDRGLRVTMTVAIEWSILGVDVPVHLRAVTVEIEPVIVGARGAEKLAFKVRLVDVEAALLPAFLDATLVARVNVELERRHVELAWDFVDTLSHAFELPATLETLRGVALHAAWGSVKVNPEALVLAVSFHANIERRGESPVPATPPPAQPSPSAPPAHEGSDGLLQVGLFGVAGACATLGAWSLARALRG